MIRVGLERAGRIVSAAALIGAWAGVGCETRVVELAPGPESGGTGSTCEVFMRDDGVTCRLCFSPAGEVTETACPMTGMTGTGAPLAVPPVAPASTCLVTVEGTDDRCVLCPSLVAGAAAEPGCLRCDMAVDDGAGGSCRACAWSDRPDLRCAQCFDRAGVLLDDGCDRVRGQVLIYPTRRPDGGTGDGA